MEKEKSLISKIPFYILAAGALLCAILILKEITLSGGGSDYYTRLFCVQLREATIFIAAECCLGAAFFEYLRIKNKKHPEKE